MAADTTIEATETETDTETKRKAPAPVDPKVLQKVARTMWRMEFRQRSPKASAQERKAAWQSESKGAKVRARKLIRKLQASNLVVAVKD